MRGVVGASARCNSEMSVLAQANERQPGPGVQVGSFAHNTKGVSRTEQVFLMRGVALAFRKARVLISLYALLNASVLLAHIHFVMQQIAVLRTMWAHRPLHTDNSNDKRLIVLSFMVIAKNNGCPLFS